MSSPMMPTTNRIVPTVCTLMPDTVAVTANLRIAPSAIRKMDVPIPMGCLQMGRCHFLTYRIPMTSKHRNLRPANQLELEVHEIPPADNTHLLPRRAGCASHVRICTKGPALHNPRRRARARRQQPRGHARRDEDAWRRRREDLDLLARRRRDEALERRGPGR